ncbi:tyramine beta-hydroxylase [Periplaneta americana]|uniref:Tyramine beta hydroxylase n=1 Tax=Periplaneta americana TaxID=6978 RepID=I7CTE1_PERAM|nr:tyramine beta hydroxylase [Periplaneta americana]AFO63078.1 tyramine beta hydroxylase [Periplaneta americana]
MGRTAVLMLLLLVAATDAQVFSVPLDANSTFSWTVNYATETVSVEVHSPATHKDLWVAVGFSDYGELKGADLCVLWRDWRGRTHFQDTWVAKDGRLSVDSQQDCLGFRHVQKHDVIKFTFTRRFDTCDPQQQDYILEEGTTHIVWARGRGPLFRLEGLDVPETAQSHGFQRAQLLKNLAPSSPHPPDTWHHDVTNSDVHVPDDDTTYWCRVHRLPAALRTKHHVVQYEATITPGNEALVHHIEVFHCEAPPHEDVPAYEGPCEGPERPPATRVCKRVLAAWAMGALPFSYPEEAGLPIGGLDFNPYVMLEVHYNNPERRADWVDSSGVRLYLTPTLRLFDGGVMELGLEYTEKMAIPPKQPAFVLSGYCITECTAVAVPTEGILIFGSQLHTHLTGIRVFTRHIRDGRELPELNRDNHYSPHFQEIRPLKRQVRLLPGDALITTCWYKTTDRDNITLGGFAISDEMCVNYIHYYPKIDLEVCKSSISSESLQSYFRFLHEWEGQATEPELGISDNYKAVQWSPMRAHVLQELYHETPLSMQCNQSTGERFPGYWENMPITPVLFPLPPQPRDCSKQH